MDRSRALPSVTAATAFSLSAGCGFDPHGAHLNCGRPGRHAPESHGYRAHRSTVRSSVTFDTWCQRSQSCIVESAAPHQGPSVKLPEIGGVIFLSRPHEKPVRMIDEQVSILRGRGLVIEDHSQACRYLLNGNYYRLSGHFCQFQVDPRSGDDRFVDRPRQPR